jgi:hypothetical protein
VSDVRKVKTGTDENGNDLFAYEFGGEVNGTFVPFVTKPAGYIEHLAEARKENEPAQAAQQGEQSAESDEASY